MIILSKLLANWPAPANIHALTTQRYPGFSQAPYDTNNLGLHVGDEEQQVLLNRSVLAETLQLPAQPAWLEQTHSNHCVIVEEESNRRADAAITRSNQQVLAIMTADCLPILLCNQQGTEIAAIHAGWRGLVNGIIENTVAKMHSPPADLLAWIGPGICQACYEVGHDVLTEWTKHYSFAAQAFKAQGKKWLANLPLLAELILNQMSIFNVFHSQVCTFEQKNAFFSYRRAPQTGRMATLIWFNQG